MHRYINRRHPLSVTKNARAYLSSASFCQPRFVEPASAWIEHAPFASWLVSILRPRSFVELGTHGGYSYFAVCQAVEAQGLETRCYAVDHWKGDAHAGLYGEDVFARVDRHNNMHYAAFSRLVRSTFDDAVAHFPDNSIDLLHIDGRHFYEDVAHDFETWRPKLSERAVVLFHDTNVRERGFGVFRLWSEFCAGYSNHFEFHHAHGLGVLGYGRHLPASVVVFFDATKDADIAKEVRRAYACLGGAIRAGLTAQQADVHLRSIRTQLESELARHRDEATAQAAKAAAADAARTEAQRRITTLEAAVAEAADRVTRLSKELAERTNQLTETQAKVTEVQSRVIALETAVREADNRATNLLQGHDESAAELTRARGTIAAIESLLAERERDVARYVQRIAAIKASLSWRLMAPFREMYRPVHRLRRSRLGIKLRAAWRHPANSRQRKAFRANRMSEYAPGNPHRTYRSTKSAAKMRALMRHPLSPKHRKAYRDHLRSRLIKSDCRGTQVDQLTPPVAVPKSAPDPQRTDYVPPYEGESLSNPPARLIAFYLPQFHPIPENDAFWGKGFTEWTNVTRAVPQFQGHYQPRLPAELGFYDLRVSAVQKRQIQLAKSYGLHGFCFHFYWFAGKRLLEMPLEQFVSDPENDFRFCLNWANENWTRRWDGREHDVLLAQQHSPEDDLAFIEYVSRYLRDPRYIRLAGKPLLIVYRPALLPNPSDTVVRWREWCRANGIGEIYLACTQSFESTNPLEYGFDGSIEFPPNNSDVPDAGRQVTPLRQDFRCKIYDWHALVERSRSYPQPEFPLFRGVCPSWDNTARKGNHGTILLNSSPQDYEEWLLNAIFDTRKRFSNPDDRFIFVNAWNEWAEGAYLEPDARYGYAYLRATRRALAIGHAYVGPQVERPLAAPYGPIAKVLQYDALTHSPPLPGESICVQLHLFYVDLADHYVVVLRRLKIAFTLLVSVPEKEEAAVWRQFFQERVPFASEVIVRNVPNRGRDVLPWVVTFVHEIQEHTILCHLHTKRSVHSHEHRHWRHFLEHTIFGSPSLINQILELFNDDPSLALVYPPYWGSLSDQPDWGSNKITFDHLYQRMTSAEPPLQCPHFPAGSFFWVRTRALQPLYSLKLTVNAFPIESEQVDGTLAHAIERLLGVLPYTVGMRSLCVGVDVPSHLTLDEDEVEKAVVPEHVVRGNLDRDANDSRISGWVARVGDNRPRSVRITIDGRPIATVVADRYRPDLEQVGYNQGRHGFSFLPPSEYFDGLPHSVEAEDEATGTILGVCQTRFARRQRHHDFEGFLRDSLINPEIQAPFREEDKRCFAAMEAIRARLCSRAKGDGSGPLFSIIMPVHNREATLFKSIQSVLLQSYPHFELVVVDDGSTDRSIAVVRSFQDERIRPIQQSLRRGVSAARNLGLRAAKGEFVAYLDSDNTMHPDFLMTFAGAFTEFKGASALYCAQALYSGEDSAPRAIRYGSLNRALLRNTNYIDLNALVHRADLVECVGEFDEELQRFVDYDYILRIAESGRRIYSLPVILSNYFYGLARDTLIANDSLMPILTLVRQKERRRLKSYRVDKGYLNRPVTIIMPSYQCLSELQDCMAAIRHACDSSVSVVVVDNNSDRDVRKYLGEIHGSDRVRVVFNPVNYGFSYAVNQGLRLADARDDIVILNNDAILSPGSLEALQRCAYSDPQIALAVPQQVLPGGTNTITAHVPFAAPEIDCDVNLSWHHNNIAHVPCFHDGGPLDLSFAPFFCAYIKRHVIEELGGLDAEFGRHYRSDRTFCNLLRHQLKMRIVYTPEAVVHHKLQAATHQLRSAPTEFEMLVVRNEWPAELREELGFRKAIWE